MPWPDEETLGAHEGLDPRPVLWDLLEMVLDGDGLSVEREGAEVPVSLQDVEEPRDHWDESRAIAFEPLVPLAVPVRVRDHERAPAETAPQESDRPRCRDAGDHADRHPAEDVEGVMHADDDARQRRCDAEQQDRRAIARGDRREGDRGAHGQRSVAGRERERGGMRDDRFRRVGYRMEGTWPP